MTKGLKGALLAPALGALLMVAAPGTSFAAPAQHDKPPADSRGPNGGAHSGHTDNPDPKNGHAANPGDHNADKGAKDPNAGTPPKGDDQASKNPDAGTPPKGDDNAGKNPNAGNPPKGDDGKNPDMGKNPGGDKSPDAGRNDRDRNATGHDDNWYGHYDHNRYGYHGHHNWDTHRRYYRWGYHGPGWYDDCGYYGANGYDGYYDSPDACDWQYGSQGESLRSNMSGDQEVGRPGAPNSFGTANLFVDVNAGRLCYRLGYDGTDQVTMAHIHRGGPGQIGDPVIDLHPEANGDEGCVGADPTVLRNLAAHPEAFYLNLHTAEYPDGAMRGQLYSTDQY